jgi:glucose dehydrogenase
MDLELEGKQALVSGSTSGIGYAIAAALLREHVVMQANKNGFFYVLDASTGELLRAQAFTQMNWADGVDMTTGRPRVRPEARYGAGNDFNGIPGA